jgi:hypothetical protein
LTPIKEGFSSDDSSSEESKQISEKSSGILGIIKKDRKVQNHGI